MAASGIMQESWASRRGTITLSGERASSIISMPNCAMSSKDGRINDVETAEHNQSTNLKI